MNTEVLRADSITRSFGTRRVLQGATVVAHAGAVTVVLGRNGSGKSTLFRIAAGLDRADQGMVFLDGTPRPRPRLHSLAREGLFFLPERGLLPRSGTIRDHVECVRRFAGAAAHEQALDALAIAELLDRPADLLSGGERRRAEVALAWLRRPRCLIADEPLMGIAPADADVLVDALRAIARGGCAVLTSGHEVPHMMKLADEVVWLAAGTTHGLGSAAAAREHWQFRREYLGT